MRREGRGSIRLLDRGLVGFEVGDRFPGLSGFSGIREAGFADMGVTNPLPAEQCWDYSLP